MTKWTLSLEYKDGKHIQPSQCDKSYNQNEGQKDFIILIDAEKKLIKIHYYMIKTLKRLAIEGTYINTAIAVFVRPTASTMQKQENLKGFPVRSTTWQGYSQSPLLYNIVLEILPRAIRQEKEMEAI